MNWFAKQVNGPQTHVVGKNRRFFPSTKTYKDCWIKTKKQAYTNLNLREQAWCAEMFSAKKTLKNCCRRSKAEVAKKQKKNRRPNRKKSLETNWWRKGRWWVKRSGADFNRRRPGKISPRPGKPELNYFLFFLVKNKIKSFR